MVHLENCEDFPLEENDEHFHVLLVDYEDHVSINTGRKWQKSTISTEERVIDKVD